MQWEALPQYNPGMGPLLRNASITNNTHYWEESPITTLIIITEDCKSINFITSSLIMRQRCIHYYCHYSLMNLSLIQSNYQLLLSLWVLSPLHYPLSLLNHRKVPFPLLSHYWWPKFLTFSIHYSLLGRQGIHYSIFGSYLSPFSLPITHYCRE